MSMTLGIKLTADGSQATREIVGVQDSLGRLHTTASKPMDAGLNTMEAAARQASSVVPGLGRELQQMSSTGGAALQVTAGELEALRLKFDPAYAAAQRLTTQTKELSTALSAGAITQQRHAQLMGQMTQAHQSAGVSMGQITQATRQLPLQMQDIFVSLQGGMSPLTVFMQQGSQIAGSYGSAGLALKSVASYLVGMVNPLTVAAAAVAALGLAYYQGSKETDAYRQALLSTGNAAGTSTAQMADMARGMGSAWGVTQGAAAEALAAMAATGRVGSVNLREYSQVAIDMEKSFGVSLADTAKHFGELGKDPVGASVRLNESMNYLTASTYAQIKAAADNGDAAKAAALAQDAYAQAMKGRASEVVSNLGYMELAWASIKKVAGETWDAMLGVGRSSTPGDELAKATRQLADREAMLKEYGNRGGVFGDDTATQVAKLKDQVYGLQELERQQKRAGTAAAQRAAAEKAGIAAIEAVGKANEKGVPKQEQMTKALKDYRDNLELAKKAGAEFKPDQIKNAEAAIRDQFKVAPPKATESETLAKQQAKTYAELVTAMQSKVEAARLEAAQTDKLTESQKQQLAIEKLVKDGKISARDASSAKTTALIAEMKAAEDLKRTEAFRKAQADADEKALEALQKEVESIRKANDVMALHSAEIGLTTEQLNALRLARLDNEIAIQAGIVAEYDEAKARGELTAQMQLEINKLEELNTKRSLSVGGQQAQVAADAAKKAADDWRRASDQINQSLTDALMRGFESGKGFAQNLRDTLKNMFNTLVLRPVIQTVVGGVTGLGGASASAGGGDPVGTFNALKGIYSTGSATMAVGGQWMAGTMSSANAAGTLGANMTGTGIDGLLASNGAYGTAGSSATTLGAAGTMLGGALVGFMAGKMISGGYSAVGKSGNTAVVAGTAIGAMVGGPIGAAIGGAIGGAVNRAFGMKAKEVTGEGITGTFGPSGASVQGYSDWMQKGGLFRSNKSGREMSALPAEISSLLSDSVGALRTGVSGYAATIGLSTDAVETFSKSVNISLKGLDAAGREKAINDALSGFGEDMAKAVLGTAGQALQRQGETASAALVRLSTSLGGVNDMLKTLGQTALDVSLSGADAASKLTDLFGGLQGMQQATSAYYQAYHSETERNAKTKQQLTAALAGMGAKLPESIPAWRALVEAQDLSTEAGRKNWAMLVQLAPAFAQVENAATALAQQLANETVAAFNAAIDAAKAFAEASKASLTTELDKQISASQSAATTARQAAEAYLNASQTLTNAAREMLAGVGDIAQNTAHEYQRVLDLARGGNVDAMGRLPGAATAMLASQRDQSATRVEATLKAAQTAVDMAAVAAAAGVAATSANYQARLFDVNTAMLEVLRADLAKGDVTVELLRQHLAALGSIGQMITASQNLTVGTFKDEGGKTRVGLLDNGGKVVASLDATTALQLQGMAGQSSSFSNSITGQTSVFGGLSKEQVLGLQKIEGETSAVARLTDIVAVASSGNKALSQAILLQLQVPDAGSNFLSQTIASGNQFLAGRLEGVIAAINKQTSEQQAQLKRQQDLENAQAKLKIGASSLADSQAKYAAIDASVRDLYQQMKWVGRDPGGWNIYEWPAAYWQAENQRVDMQRSLQQTEIDINALRAQIRALGGVPSFSVGGYTGPGGVSDVAGIVHKGEIVWSQADIARSGGPVRVEAMRVGAVPAALRPVATRSSDQASEQAGPELVQQIVYLRAELRSSLATAQEHLAGMQRLTRGWRSVPVSGNQSDLVDVRVAA